MGPEPSTDDTGLAVMGRVSGFWLQTAVDDLFTGTLGDIDPGIPLGVLAGLTGAGMSAGLTVILTGLDNAVAFFGAFLFGRRLTAGLTGGSQQTQSEDAGKGGMDDSFAVHGDNS
ncbi:hypothetical protein BN874_2890002 [Candidatus Contendobacter odensis Run_B_J11]|uniref:Uncharacterized protein n=1 Tax=Candidatus Contendobacter odensis Run_B_J11 TaxID=1400861 RepID=A0A7U7GCP2_9GAMM|nr:hypothetical protein BN874_2890002 [Candidatus Contendobacter odensis Run_B_J11]